MNEELLLSPREDHIGGWWDALLSETRDGFGLLGPSSYILNLGGKRLLVDPCVRSQAVADALASRIARDMMKFDGVILTHEHEDHYDPYFVKLAAATGVHWYIPDFFYRARMREFGLCDQNVTLTNPGMTVRFGSASVKFFESNHKNEGAVNFIREYGFTIEYAGKRLVFPIDVRTYDLAKMPRFDHVDILFAHVWLGRGRALEELPEPKLTEFCAFLAHFRAERIMLAHLYETGRTPEEMWTMRHASLIRSRLPEADITVPEPGKWNEF